VVVVGSAYTHLLVINVSTLLTWKREDRKEKRLSPIFTPISLRI